MIPKHLENSRPQICTCQVYRSGMKWMRFPPMSERRHRRKTTPKNSADVRTTTLAEMRVKFQQERDQKSANVESTTSAEMEWTRFPPMSRGGHWRKSSQNTCNERLKNMEFRESTDHATGVGEFRGMLEKRWARPPFLNWSPPVRGSAPRSNRCC